jgi:hypothetical protein
MDLINDSIPQNGSGWQEPASKTADKPVILTLTDKIEAGDLHTVKCYRCFSYEVEAICHHCGRFLCQKCLRKTSWFFADNAFAHVRPLVDNQLRHGAHCEDCFHRDLQAEPIMVLISSLLALLLFWITWPQLNWSQKGLFIGSAAVTIGLVTWLASRFLPFWVSYPHGFPPLFSRTKIKIQERIRANFHITGGDYLSPEPSAEGVIEVKLTVGPNDKTRYESAPPPKHSVGLHAGFIALETLKNVEFAKFNGSQQRHNLLYLTKIVTPNEFERLCHRSGDFYLVKPYRIQTEALQVGPPDDKEFPLLIKPRRANGGYRLEIIFEMLNKKVILKYAKDGSEKEGEDDKGLEGKPILEILSLKIPVGCEVEYTDGYHDKQDRVIRWYRQRLDITPPYAAYVQFRHVLKNDIQFEGQYVVAVDDWTISQVHVAPGNAQTKDKFIIRPANGLRLSPRKKDKEDKKKWLEPIVEHQTKIEGQLRFNTTYLFSQQVQMASDSLLDSSQPEVKGKEELLVAPTHHVINVIIEALTNENVFIQNVIETLGDVKEMGTSSYRAKYWEIMGKYFVEGTLQPVQLHLIILGEGAQSYRPNSEGISIVELSLRSYVEMTDLVESPDWLKGEYGRLRNIIKIAAYQGRHINYKGRRILAWQREKQFENELRQHFSLNGDSKLSIILTGDTNPKNMHIFISPLDAAKWLTGLPKHITLCSRPQLPSISDDWVDKWELLKDVEMELQNGRK